MHLGTAGISLLYSSHCSWSIDALKGLGEICAVVVE
ncbi:hypothetical protein T12_919 [Trichinella patagoniensis]|uniref:Uncharacterized protein n=1 Tax=Trichinella patagoniensis TaxID=990121 RepID=A0A0V0YPT8_9BILA|nr:hypothetical protein T12_919 [Trichinella patagoniensis]